MDIKVSRENPNSPLVAKVVPTASNVGFNVNLGKLRKWPFYEEVRLDGIAQEELYPAYRTGDATALKEKYVEVDSLQPTVYRFISGCVGKVPGYIAGMPEPRDFDTREVWEIRDGEISE